MLPWLVVVGLGRGRWFLPLPLPVFLLWPLVIVPLLHRLFVPDALPMRILRVAAAARGLAFDIRGLPASASSCESYDPQQDGTER